MGYKPFLHRVLLEPGKKKKKTSFTFSVNRLERKCFSCCYYKFVELTLDKDCLLNVSTVFLLAYRILENYSPNNFLISR